MSPSIISGCFKHCGFVSPVEDSPAEDNLGDPTDSDSNSDTNMAGKGKQHREHR